ncbi:hypothetical protein GH714_010810 [Hevea brasiliensis]|uniref:Uncharacterized protein n=1 Tax=Hevea brasiliensis TaxID=3981 RepID=A0A6A6KDY9_HEVBR|nr:hypothetical protein GH714_010810 [Hevea brasiliensis]
MAPVGSFIRKALLPMVTSSRLSSKNMIVRFATPSRPKPSNGKDPQNNEVPKEKVTLSSFDSSETESKKSKGKMGDGGIAMDSKATK